MKKEKGIALITLILIIIAILIVGGVGTFLVLKDRDTKNKTDKNEKINLQKNIVETNSTKSKEKNIVNDTLSQTEQENTINNKISQAEQENIINNKISQTENKINNNSTQIIEDQIEETDVNDYNSNKYIKDEKLVYNYNDQYYIVCYYKGETITGLEWHFRFEDYEQASGFKEALESENHNIKNIDAVYVKGEVVIVKMTENDYENYTTSEMKEMYSILEKIENYNV